MRQVDWMISKGYLSTDTRNSAFMFVLLFELRCLIEKEMEKGGLDSLLPVTLESFPPSMFLLSERAMKKA
jgi:hypothetical protein